MLIWARSIEPRPRKRSTSSFFLNSLTFFGWFKEARRPFCGAAVAGARVLPSLAVAEALVIGVGHVNDLADGGKVGFSFAQQTESIAPEIGEDAFFGDLDFEFVRGHFSLGELVGNLGGDRNDFEDGGPSVVAGVAAFTTTAGFGDEER